MRRTIEIAALLALSLLAALAVHAWLASRDEQMRLASILAAQKQILDSASARETSRDATLNAALGQIEKLKRDTQTPEQIVRDLPKYLPLPQPITLVEPQAAAALPPSQEEINGSRKGTGASERQGIGHAQDPPAPCKTSSPPSLSASRAKRLSGSRIGADIRRKLGRASRGEMSAADCGSSSTQLYKDALPGQSVGAAGTAGTELESDRVNGSSSASAENSPGHSNSSSLLNIPRDGQQGSRTPEPLPLSSKLSNSSRQDSPAGPEPTNDQLDRKGTRAPEPSTLGLDSSYNLRGNSPVSPTQPADALDQKDTRVPPEADPQATCPKPDSCAAQIPAADLKPLYDYVQNCRACQAQLAAAQQNSADDARKIDALTRERDAAVTAAKGGSFLRQLRRNTLWFATGAIVGFAAAKR